MLRSLFKFLLIKETLVGDLPPLPDGKLNTTDKQRPFSLVVPMLGKKPTHHHQNEKPEVKMISKYM